MLYLLLTALVGVAIFMLTSFLGYLLEHYTAAREARRQARAQTPPDDLE